MHATGIQSVEIVFLLLLALVIIFAALARKLQTPYPIVLVVAGLLVSFAPGIPRFTLNPEIIFLVVLPPLLYSAAWVTSWRDFSHNLTSIVMLALGLVVFTVIGVAIAAPYVIPGFTWQLGFVLGAVVATTDAIAATSIAKRLGLPQRIVDVLEGESLVNDASGLLALEFAIALVVRQQPPTPAATLLRLVYLIVFGLSIGLVIARIVEWLEYHIDDAPIEIALSFLVPYVAYLAAEAVNASGVLAVVACGLYLSRQSARFFSAKVRIQAWAVWDSITFILNGIVFICIGLQLPSVLEAIHGISTKTLLLYGALFSAVVILLRLFWTYPGANLAYYIRHHWLHQRYARPSNRQIFVVGWTGMRGVIALAAALSLPETLRDGSPFPQRNLIIFLTFCVILVTLVLQGLTLPWVIRKLGLAHAAGPNCEEREARRIVARAALDRLEASRTSDRPEFAPIYDDLHQHYRHRLAAIDRDSDAVHPGDAEHYLRSQDIKLELLRAEREAAIALRSEGRINDEVLRTIEHELDLRETELSPSPEG